MQVIELGHIVLYVSDLERVADFYQHTLGFHQLARQWPMAVFSGGRTHHELLLIEVGGSPVHSEDARPGLYHIGFKIGDGPEAAREAYIELVKKGVSIVGTTDHGVTHSMYILDPDGNELELYADITSAWKEDPLAILSPARPLQF